MAGLERFLPPSVGGSSELRHRTVALLRTAVWTGTWAGVLAGLFAWADRVYVAAMFGFAALAAFAVLPRVRRTGNAPGAATWLGRHLLVASLVGAAGSGGLASPITFAAGLAAATAAAFGNPHGLAWALLVPMLLHGADLLGVTSAPLGPALGGAATFATFALVVGAVAEYLLGERGSRAAMGAEAARSGRLDARRLEREAARMSGLVEHLPVGWLAVDRAGRIERCSPQLPFEVPVDSELLALYVAGGVDPSSFGRARAALAAWRDGAALEPLLGELPRSLDGRALAYGRLPAEDGFDERLLVATLDPSGAEAAGGLTVGHLLGVEASAWGRSAVRVDARGGNGVPVPDPVAGILGDGLRALVDNAVAHASSLVELRCEVRSRVVVLSVSDDGPGVDWTEVEARAARNGWPCGSRQELWRALVGSGMSTTGRRGRGLARARAAVESLAGRLVLAESVDNAGAVFELHVPNPIPSRPRVRVPAEPRLPEPMDEV